MNLLSKKTLVEKLTTDKKFRDAYVFENVRNSIPFQIRALRDERDWTQADLGLATQKPRNVITRLENPNSNIPNLNTLLEIASGFDAALIVKIVPFSRLVKEYEDVSSKALYAASVTDEKEQERLNKWAVTDRKRPKRARAQKPASNVIDFLLNKERYANPVVPVSSDTKFKELMNSKQVKTEAEVKEVA